MTNLIQNINNHLPQVLQDIQKSQVSEAITKAFTSIKMAFGAVAALSLILTARFSVLFAKSNLTSLSQKVSHAFYRTFAGAYGDSFWKKRNITSELTRLTGMTAERKDVKLPKTVSYTTAAGKKVTVETENWIENVSEVDSPWQIPTKKHKREPLELQRGSSVDVLDVAKSYADRGEKVAFLNFAHSSGAGGTFWKAPATPLQEESIHNRCLNSLLMDFWRNPHLRSKHRGETLPTGVNRGGPHERINVRKEVKEFTVADLPASGSRLVKDVVVMRDRHLNTIQPWNANMIAAAAPCMRDVDPTQPLDLSELKKSLRTVYFNALFSKSSVLILGAFGCGGFSPRQQKGEELTAFKQRSLLYREAVADAMMEVHSEYATKGLKVVFAIKEMNARDKETADIFSEKISALNG